MPANICRFDEKINTLFSTHRFWNVKIKRNYTLLLFFSRNDVSVETRREALDVPLRRIAAQQIEINMALRVRMQCLSSRVAVDSVVHSLSRSLSLLFQLLRVGAEIAIGLADDNYGARLAQVRWN